MIESLNFLFAAKEWFLRYKNSLKVLQKVTKSQDNVLDVLG
jgi:hypothetical protein